MTDAAFFYGTLMHPRILQEVLRNDGSHLAIAPALLLDHTRHHVVHCDYPGLLPYARSQPLLGRDLPEHERCVRGSLVSGLTHADLRLLDEFEGDDEYERLRVLVHPLSDHQDLRTSSLHSPPPSPDVPARDQLRPPVAAWTYIWTAPVSRLAPSIWSYEVFVREQLWQRWVSEDVSDKHENTPALDMQGSVDHAVREDQPAPVATTFGHAMHRDFCFDPEYVTLNHGSYGSLPKPVLKATEALAIEAEAKPDLFMRRTYLSLLKEVRAKVARLINANTDECVIVPNATHGINTVLMNIEWKKGDVIVGFTTTYGAISSTLSAMRDRHPGLSLKIISVVYPMSHAGLLQLFQAELLSVPRHPGQTVLAVIDGIVSVPGVIMPWEEMVHVCKQAGVLSLVDGAHLIGQLPVDLNLAQPDFWVTNCHKWLFSKRGSAVLYVPRRNQHFIKITLPISIGYVSETTKPIPDESARFVRLFEWTGTIDYVPFLSIKAAMDFRESIGGETKINEYCHNLAVEGGQRMASLLGTRVLDESGELTANMTNVLLPMSTANHSARELREMLLRMQDTLLDEYKCFVAVFIHDNKWWARCSAQIWNEMSDFEYIGQALLRICKGLSKTE